MSEQPAPQQIARFIDCFNTLSMFEAQTRAIRGIGAFNRFDWPEMPDSDVIAVAGWLSLLASREATNPVAHDTADLQASVVKP